MRIAVQPGGGMAKHLVGEVLVAIAAFTDGKITASALLAFATCDGERHDDAFADLELAHITAEFNDFTHELVAHDVAMLHARHEAVVEVQIGTADRATRHLTIASRASSMTGS